MCSGVLHWPEDPGEQVGLHDPAVELLTAYSMYTLNKATKMTAKSKYIPSYPTSSLLRSQSNTTHATPQCLTLRPP